MLQVFIGQLLSYISHVETLYQGLQSEVQLHKDSLISQSLLLQAITRRLEAVEAGGAIPQQQPYGKGSSTNATTDSYLPPTTTATNAEGSTLQHTTSAERLSWVWEHLLTPSSKPSRSVSTPMGDYGAMTRERSGSGSMVNGLLLGDAFMGSSSFGSSSNMDLGADPLILGPRASQALRGTSSPTSHPFESSTRFRNGSYSSSTNLLRDMLAAYSSPPETPSTSGGNGFNSNRLNNPWNKVKAFNPTWSTGE